MGKFLACPAVDDLRRLARGEITDADAAVLAEHVLWCASCAHRLDAVHSDDCLFADLPALRDVRAAHDPDADVLARRLAGASPTGVKSPTGGLGPDADHEPPPERIGRYRVVRRLGTGGFGVVYLAEDEQLHRSVAVKVPHRAHVARAADVAAYLAEARALAGLDHPHIVPVYDVGGGPDGPCYIVSKYIDGCSLAQSLARARPTPAAAVALAATVAAALHHAHLRGLVHRDVKPGNILLDRHGQPFLADFGLALHAADDGTGPRLAGTPAYMSPEQAAGAAHRVDGRSDVYSLGVVLYEMLCGRLPFRADARTELLEQIATRDPRPLRQIDEAIPRELERICLRALAKRPADRYLTAQDFAEELRRFLSGASPAATAARTSPPADAAGRATRRVLACVVLPVAALLVAVVAPLVLWLAWLLARPNPPPAVPEPAPPRAAARPPAAAIVPTPVGAAPAAAAVGQWREFSAELPMFLAPGGGLERRADEPFLRRVEDRLVEPFDAAEMAEARAARQAAGLTTDPPCFLYLYTPAGPMPPGKKRASVAPPDELRGRLTWWALLVPAASGPTVRGVADPLDRAAGTRTFAVVPVGDYRIVLAAVPLTAACENRLRSDAAPAFVVRLTD